MTVISSFLLHLPNKTKDYPSSVSHPSLVMLCILLFSQGAGADVCLKTAGGFGNTPPCTANDLQTALITKFAGPPVCVDGGTIYVQMQANTLSGSNQRYDVGYFINLDGGSANDGVLCYRDYLPPPLNTTPWTGSGNRNSPFFDADTDQCGDPELSKTLTRNLGGATVSSGMPGPPAIIAISCKDLDNLGTPKTVDVSACTSWDNNDMGVCNSVTDAFPGTGSKCSCLEVSVGDIVYLPLCRNNDDCNDNNACTTDSCNTLTDFKCTNTPIGAGTSCDDGNPCTTMDVCSGSPATTCLGTDTSCPDLSACLVGACDFATGACIGVDTCPSGQLCQSGSCVPRTSCTLASQCDDSLLCTDDTCTDGLCYNTPKTCTALDQCHGVGTCNAITGVCSNPVKADGSSCNDGDICTSFDVCTNGSCAGTTSCTALDQCHDAGTCDSSTGACTNPLKANGSSCNDDMLCTSPDVCTNGSCAGTDTCLDGAVCEGNQCVGGSSCVDASSCDDANPCTDDACVDLSCTHTNNSASCNDGISCTSSDICTNGICAGVDNCGPGQRCQNNHCVILSQGITLSKDFRSNDIPRDGRSILTITLSNANGAPANLIAPLVDNLPGPINVIHLVSNTCGGTVTAVSGSSTITLTGGSIPAYGSCVVKVKVTVHNAGVFVNTLPANALRTNRGNNVIPASATLKVHCKKSDGDCSQGPTESMDSSNEERYE
jgi:hypothetical protein